MKNKKIIWIVLLVIGAMLIIACGGTTSPVDGGDTSSPTQSSSGNQSATSSDLVLDPANATGDNALSVIGYMYEGLTRVQDGNIAPALAEAYTVSEDGLDYIFDLRSGVSFHDGSPLNADAVIANFNRWFDPADANRGSGDFVAWLEKFGGFKDELTEDGKPTSQYDGIEKVDDLTVLVHLNTPDPDFLLKLANPAFSIVSPNTFDGGDGGTGVYRFSSSDGSNFILEPFAGYWDASALASESMTVPAP